MKSLPQEEIQYIMETNGDEASCQDLDKANLVINQFIRSCSHSMRGPLKSIRGLVNMLKHKNPGSDLDPAMVIGFIEESTDKMETMLEELEQFMLNSRKQAEN